MKRQKINTLPASSNDLISPQVIQSIKQLLKKTDEGIIAFDIHGTILSINHKAAQLLHLSPKQLINHNLWQYVKLDSFKRKRQFIEISRCFLAAKNGLSQQYTWIENSLKKPILAYNIMINKAEIYGTSVIFATLTDALQNQMIEWALWSLAKIGNHRELNEVIDEILSLVSDVFSADYAAICLIDSQQQAHAVSYYHLGEKKENINYPFQQSIYPQPIRKNSIVHINEVQKKFPHDLILKERHINSYLLGPILNTHHDLVGYLNVLTNKTIKIDPLNSTLFDLFLKRINLEIERLLDQRKLQFLASITQQDPNPVLRILPSGQIIFANKQGKHVLKSWRAQLPEQLLNAAHNAQRSRQVIRVELQAGNQVYLFALIWIDEFKQINIYGTDITQLKNTERSMLNMARIDALTQIANRQYFEEILMQQINQHQHNKKNLAILLIDLDNFKAINDSLGHQAGDQVLKEASQRMLRSLRKDDFIARLGGDEFIVLLEKSNSNKAIQVAEKIISVLAQTFYFGEYHLNITASIGIAMYPDTGLSKTELLKHADIAMYEAKKSGKNTYALFSKSTHYAQNKRNELIRAELKFAAANQQLFIEYQPQIDIQTNKIIGFEALLRWKHPQEGLILPIEFIPIAEQTGCIHLISEWLIKQSFQDFAILSTAGLDIKLFINISLSQLNDERFLQMIHEHMLQNPIDKNQIILDISERALSSQCKHLAQNGIMQLCLDNFGSPKISLLKLLALPISYLKLDQQLLLGVVTNEKYRILLKGIIQLTQELHIKTIQKGVETEEQHLLLQSLGCQYAQGFYYCKPIEISKVPSFLDKLYR